MEIDKTLTAEGGAPVNDNQNSPIAGPKAPILIEERKYRWPLRRLPDDHPGLSSFGFREKGYRIEPALAALRQYLLEWMFMRGARLNE